MNGDLLQGTPRNKFTVIPNFIIDDLDLKPAEFKVYSIMLRHNYADGNTGIRKGWCDAGTRSIAKRARISKEKLYEVLFVLDRAGLIRIMPPGERSSRNGYKSSRRGRASNLYMLLNLYADQVELYNMGLKSARDQWKYEKKVNSRPFREKFKKVSYPQKMGNLYLASGTPKGTENEAGNDSADLTSVPSNGPNVRTAEGGSADLTSVPEKESYNNSLKIGKAGQEIGEHQGDTDAEKSQLVQELLNQYRKSAGAQ